MEIKDHDEFPEFDHRCPLRAGNRVGDQIAVRRPGARPGTATTRGTGENSNGTSGENYSGINNNRGEKRTNETHASTTDPDERLTGAARLELDAAGEGGKRGTVGGKDGENPAA